MGVAECPVGRRGGGGSSETAKEIESMQVSEVVRPQGSTPAVSSSKIGRDTLVTENISTKFCELGASAKVSVTEHGMEEMELFTEAPAFE